MVNHYNLYGIKTAGPKYKRRLLVTDLFTDPYAYRLADVFVAAYSVSNIYSVSICQKYI